MEEEEEVLVVVVEAIMALAVTQVRVCQGSSPFPWVSRRGVGAA